MDDLIETEQRGTLRTIWLNRTGKLNAFNPDLIRAFGGAVRDAATASEVKVIAIRGRGRAFSAGMDIALFDVLRGHGANDGRVRRFMHELQQDLIVSIERAEKPVIAAIHGLCFGAGFEMALACDIRVATDDAAFALPEVRLGVIPEAGGCHRLARHVGVGRAKDIAMTGRRVNTDEAVAIGLVQQVAADAAGLDALLNEYAVQFEQCGPLAVGLIKRVIDNGFSLEPGAGLDLEVQAGNTLYATNDAKEACDALREKRAPRFTGT